MAFKLGRETREFKTPRNVGPIVRKKLGKGILGEANNDGSIFINKDIKPGSEQEKTTIRHEGKHAEDMQKGILDYGDDWIRYKGKTYHRKTIGGVPKIKYNNKWYPEGDMTFPWEKAAKKAETKK
jgi:hypothetical protein